MLRDISLSVARECIVNVFIDLIIKTTFEYFGYNRYNTYRSIILFFVPIILLKTGMTSACFNLFVITLHKSCAAYHMQAYFPIF